MGIFMYWIIFILLILCGFLNIIKGFCEFKGNQDSALSFRDRRDNIERFVYDLVFGCLYIILGIAIQIQFIFK